MLESIENFEKMFSDKSDVFCAATPDQITKLKKLFGDNVNKIIDFYSGHQPNHLPMLDCYLSLLGIDHILMENISGEPGKYLAGYGVYVFAVTVGGNVLCIDTNNCTDGDAAVLIADANFCSYNECHDCIEIGVLSDELYMELEEDRIVRLNYYNIKKCLTMIESSFFTFLNKLSRNEYEDIEAFL